MPKELPQRRVLKAIISRLSRCISKDSYDQWRLFYLCSPTQELRERGGDDTTMLLIAYRTVRHSWLDLFVQGRTCTIGLLKGSQAFCSVEFFSPIDHMSYIST
jgi:hypothetical protein